DRDVEWGDEHEGHAPDPSEATDGAVATVRGGVLGYESPAATLDTPGADTVPSTAAVADAVGAVADTVGELTGADETSERPVEGAFLGQPFFDATLGHPVWWGGTEWVDATGAAV